MGRFLQADTIVPEPGNPQAWDRYAYVYNNALRYTDPTGHKYDPGGDTWGGSPSPSHPIPEQDTRRSVSYDEENGFCINYGNIGCTGTVESNSEWIQWNFSHLLLEASWWFFDEGTSEAIMDLSTVFTDLALLASSAGATVEIAATVLGATAGIDGLIVGAILGHEFHLVITNPIETVLSGAATSFAILGDISAGNTTLYTENDTVFMSLGGASATALVTQGIGLFTNLGVADAAIDGYSSSYSHGLLPGIPDVKLSIVWR